MNRTKWMWAALTALIVMVGCGRKQVEEQEAVRPVRTAVVEDASSGRTRLFTGVARAAVETILSFRVGGEIIRLPIRVGVPVQTGDLIAQLDSTDYELQVKQLEAQLALGEAQLRQSRAEYERVRLLYESRNASKSDLDQGRAAFESAQAQRETLAQQLQLSRKQLEYCTLKAPIPGTIASKPVDTHQSVAPGQAIATMTSGDDMEIMIGIPETLITRVHVGAEAAVRFEVVPNETFSARVSEVGIEPSSASTYPVKLVLQGMDSRIRSGMIGEVALTFDTADRAGVYVPPVAVLADPSGEQYVWVYDDQGRTVCKRIITIGALTSEGLQILDGLKAGERIVVRGVNRIKEGMKVKPLDDTM